MTNPVADVAIPPKCHRAANDGCLIAAMNRARWRDGGVRETIIEVAER